MSTHSISAPAAAGNDEYTPMADPFDIGVENYPPRPLASDRAQTVAALARLEWGTRAAMGMLLAAATMANDDDDRAYLLAQADEAGRAILAPPSVLSVFRQGIPWVGAAVTMILAAVAVVWFLV